MTDTANALSAPIAKNQFTRFVSRDHVWSLGGQALVSAASFLSLFLLAHWSDVSEVGTYSVALSLLAMFLVLVDSLILRPYTVRLFSCVATREQHSFSALLLTAGLTAAAFVVLAIWGFFSDPGSGLAMILAAALPVVALREFTRRHAFANLLMQRAFYADMFGVAACIALLLLLGWAGELRATTAVVAVTYGLALPCAVTLLAARREFSFDAAAVQSTIRSSCNIGKWMLPNRLAIEGQGYVIHWTSFALAGPALTGVYSACLAIVALANPVLIGLLNVMTPRCVRAFKDGGMEGLKSQALTELALLAIVLSAFIAFIAVFASSLMAIIFPGEAYAGHADLLLLLAVGSAAGWLGSPAGVALQSSGYERIAATVATAGFLVCTVSVWIAFPTWGLTGAVVVLACVEAFVSATKWGYLLKLAGRPRSNPEGGDR